MFFHNKPVWFRSGIYGIIFDIGLYVLTIIVKAIGLQYSDSFDPDFMWNIMFFLNVPIPLPVLTALFGPLLVNLKNNSWVQLHLKYKTGIILAVISAIGATLGLVFEVAIFLIIFFPILWFSGLGEFSDSGNVWASIVPTIILSFTVFYVLGYLIGNLLDKKDKPS